MTTRRRVCAIALMAVASACGDDSLDTGISPTAVTFSSAQFSNVIGPGERRSYAFTLTTRGPVTVTLASVTSADTGAPLPISLRVAVGRPQDRMSAGHRGDRTRRPSVAADASGQRRRLLHRRRRPRFGRGAGALCRAVHASMATPFRYLLPALVALVAAG